MPLTPAEIGKLADTLAEARLARREVVFPSDMPRLDSEADAYAVQFAVHQRLEAAGERLAGWKLGVPVKAMYEPLGLPGPALAGLLASRLLPSGATLPAGWPARVGIECEVAMRMGEAAPAGNAPWTAATIRERVAALMPAIEVVENRYPDLAALNGFERVADDFLQAACVLGPETTAVGDYDLSTIYGRSLHGHVEVATGTGALIMGDPFAGLAWLANKLNALGRALRAGDVIMTGSVHPPKFLDGRGRIRVELAGLGHAEAVLA